MRILPVLLICTRPAVFPSAVWTFVRHGGLSQIVLLALCSFQDKYIRGDVNIVCASRVGSSGLDNLNYIQSFEFVSVNVTWRGRCLFWDLEHGLSISYSNTSVFSQLHLFKVNLIMRVLS